MSYADCHTLLFLKHAPTPEIYTLSLHELFRSPRSRRRATTLAWAAAERVQRPSRSGITREATHRCRVDGETPASSARSEEHTSELQSLRHLVCRLLLEKKKRKNRRDEHDEDVR